MTERLLALVLFHRGTGPVRNGVQPAAAGDLLHVNRGAFSMTVTGRSASTPRPRSRTTNTAIAHRPSSSSATVIR